MIVFLSWLAIVITSCVFGCKAFPSGSSEAAARAVIRSEGASMGRPRVSRWAAFRHAVAVRVRNEVAFRRFDRERRRDAQARMGRGL